MDLEDQGNLANYLGINVAYQIDESIIMSQPQLIDQIIRDVNLKPNFHLPPTPTSTTSILQRELNAEPFSTKHTWNYRSIIGNSIIWKKVLGRTLHTQHINARDFAKTLEVLTDEQ